MALRFRSHGRFQRSVLLLAAVGGAAGLVLWAVHVEMPHAFMAVLLAVLTGWLAHRARPAGGRSAGRGTGGPWPELAAAAAAAPACLAAPALFGDVSSSPFAATLGGWCAGLVAGLGQLAAELELVAGDAVAASSAGEGRGLSGAELALATRATAAWRRIRAGTVESTHPEDARRLRQLAERLTLEVLTLAARSHSLGAELSLVDAAVVRERAASLSRAAARAADPGTRADLARAARETAGLEERLHLSCTARDRVLARLELQTTLLEGTALALAAHRASAAADDAGALAPLCAGLGEAAGELQAEAAALGELSAPA